MDQKTLDSVESLETPRLGQIPKVLDNSPPELEPSESLVRLNSTVLPNGMPYTILQPRERTALALVLSLMGLCSSLGIGIYWVALTEMQAAFHITEEQVNLTVTVYLIFQSIAPLFVCNLADHYGRRPIQLISLIGGIAANIGIVFSRRYWLLIFMRCLLGLFLSPLHSCNGAIVGDITTGRNRGGVAGLVGGFSLVGQGISPFLGSLVDTRWHWQAIFWFSAAVDGLAFLVAFLLLPETKRSMVGNLSHAPSNWIHRAPILLFFRDRLTDTEGRSLEPPLSNKYNPFKPFVLLKEKTVYISLIGCALVYSSWTMSQATLSTWLARDYHYSTLKIGLCYFAPGVGCIFAISTSGKILDKVYRHRKKKFVEYWSQPEHRNMPRPEFDVPQARLSLFPFSVIPLTVFTLVYGWCLKTHQSVALLVASCFFITIGSMHPINISQTLLVDLYPDQAGAAMAMSNFIRCAGGAIFVSCMARMNQSMTVGGTYTLMSALSVVSIVMVTFFVKGRKQRDVEKGEA